MHRWIFLICLDSHLPRQIEFDSTGPNKPPWFLELCHFNPITASNVIPVSFSCFMHPWTWTPVNHSASMLLMWWWLRCLMTKTKTEFTTNKERNCELSSTLQLQICGHLNCGLWHRYKSSSAWCPSTGPDWPVCYLFPSLCQVSVTGCVNCSKFHPASWEALWHFWSSDTAPLSRVGEQKYAPCLCRIMSRSMLATLR